MTQFNFKKIKDKYYIKNNELVSINFEVMRIFNCHEYLTIFEGIIESGETKEFDFDIDAEYKIIINEINVVNIKHFLKLQESIIQGVIDNLCDCKCGCECGKAEDGLCNLLMLKAKLDVYKMLINPQGVAFFNAVYKHVQCLINKPVYCAVNEEIILGESKCNEEIVKQIIALDYLAIYFFEMAQSCLTEDKEYIKNKFKTKTIFCCIQSLGIDIGDIEELIENNNMGLFTINNGAYVNQPPSQVGDYTLSVANRAVTTLSLAMFTSLTTPAYADPEGDAAKEIRVDTLPVDGVLKLSGLNVTLGQIILVADINAGNLTYESPNQDALDSDTFSFSISDTGSGMFTN